MTWYPPRGPAEHISPAGYSGVTITLRPPGTPDQARTRRFTRTAVIGRLAAVLNGRPAAPPFVGSCPAFPPSTLVFTPLVPAAGARPAPRIWVALTGCPGGSIRVGGRSQPTLADPVSCSPPSVGCPACGPGGQTRSGA